MFFSDENQTKIDINFLNEKDQKIEENAMKWFILACVFQAIPGQYTIGTSTIFSVFVDARDAISNDESTMYYLLNLQKTPIGKNIMQSCGLKPINSNYQISKKLIDNFLGAFGIGATLFSLGQFQGFAKFRKILKALKKIGMNADQFAKILRKSGVKEDGVFKIIKKIFGESELSSITDLKIDNLSKNQIEQIVKRQFTSWEKAKNKIPKEEYEALLQLINEKNIDDVLKQIENFHIPPENQRLVGKIGENLNLSQYLEESFSRTSLGHFIGCSTTGRVDAKLMNKYIEKYIKKNKIDPKELSEIIRYNEININMQENMVQLHKLNLFLEIAQKNKNKKLLTEFTRRHDNLILKLQKTINDFKKFNSKRLNKIQKNKINNLILMLNKAFSNNNLSLKESTEINNSYAELLMFHLEELNDDWLLEIAKNIEK